MPSKLKRIIISPPFGNYFNFDWATSVTGSFTLEKRTGLIKQTIKTLRPIKGGWVNCIVFRNKGIKNVTFNMDDVSSQLVSVAGIDVGNDWRQMADQIPNECMVEINVGCPNIGYYGITGTIIREFMDKFRLVALKIPPTQKGIDTAVRFYLISGITYIHVANTIPTERGGESGKRLKDINIPLIRQLRQRIPNINIIGGGGIYKPQDVIDYHNAGADYFSLSTIFFTPWKVKKVKKQIDKLTTTVL